MEFLVHKEKEILKNIVVDKKTAYVINECPQRQMSDVENCRSRAIHSLIIDNVPKKVSATSEFEGKFLYT